MKYNALVKDKETNELILLEDKVYGTKKDFMSDIDGNGYTVEYIHTVFDSLVINLCDIKDLKTYLNEYKLCNNDLNIELTKLCKEEIREQLENFDINSHKYIKYCSTLLEVLYLED